MSEAIQLTSLDTSQQVPNQSEPPSMVCHRQGLDSLLRHLGVETRQQAI